MHVFFDHQIFISQPYGGVSRYFREIIPRVASAGISTEVWQGASINLYNLKSCINPHLRVRGLQVPSYPYTRKLRQWFSSAGLRFLLSKSNDTIYHPTYYGALAPSWPGITVLTVYDLIHFLFPNENRQSNLAKMTSLMRSSIANATVIVAISENTAQDLMKHLGVEKERIQVIHLGISLDSDGSEQKPFPFPYLLYVGNRYGYKNYQSLREAYERTPALHRHFALVCFGGPSPTSEDMPKEGRAQFVTGDDHYLATLYRHATIMVYPSLYEGFGLPLLEAMRHGTPVVASSCGSIPEIGGEAVCYASEPTAESLSATLVALLDDSVARATLIAKGRERVANFSWDKCAHNHVNLYRKLGDRSFLVR